jgi:hypothetical protein
MCDGPQGRGAEAALDLDDIADVESPKSKADIGICVSPVGTLPGLMPENAKVQAKRLHCLEGLG